jgi:protocatechuate 3,4-dioxygenase beta subunit
MLLSALALGVLIGQLPVSASRSQPAPDQAASITVTAEEDGSGVPIDGIAITIRFASSDSLRVASRGITLADGKMQFTGLAPGRYFVTAASSELLRSSSELLRAPGIGDPQRSVNLKPGAHEVIAFTFRRPAVIRGQVLTPAGRPVQGATVEVVTTKSEFRGRPVVEAGSGSSTDAEGRFRIEKLVPGRYLVRARLPASAEAPLNFVYAPRTTTSSQAAPVMLEAGAEVAIGITAPAVPAVAVSGRVVDAGGDPVPNATITLTSLVEDAIPPVYFGPGGLHVSAGINPVESVRTDRSGRFVVPGVRQGLYALQAVVRGPGLLRPVVAAGVTELDVLTSTIDSLTIKLLPCARITGRFLFNGLETPDSERAVVEMRPDGEDAHLRKGLAAMTSRLGDGTFVIDGLLGRHRLTLGSSGHWFAVAATLENGTDIAKGPIDFEPGRTYGNVRVWLSDETAEIEGLMPEGWSADSHSTIMVFPEDMSLLQDSRGSIQSGEVDLRTRRFSVKRIRPGHVYLVAVLSFADPGDPGAGSRDFMEILNELWRRGTRIFIGEAGKFEVTLPPRPRDR